MERETDIAKSLDITEQKAAYDAACRRLLSSKIILAWILKSCVEEYKDYDVKEIARKYIEGEPQVGEVPVDPDETNKRIHGIGNEDKTLTEGTVVYDIRFIAILPTTGEPVKLIINIEAQNAFNPGYPLIKRGIYHCSRMISAQNGVEFTHSHYEDIKKVYSIWICINSPEMRKNSITRYRITEENVIGSVKEELNNYDLMTTVMVCLGGENNERYGGILKLLDVLLSNKKKPQEKKDILKNDFDIEMTREYYEEVSYMCNISDGIEQEGIEKGREQGLAQGREQGLAQGREQGLAQGREQGVLRSIINLMDNMKMGIEQAMQILGVPQNEYEKYKTMIANYK